MCIRRYSRDSCTVQGFHPSVARSGKMGWIKAAALHELTASSTDLRVVSGLSGPGPSETYLDLEHRVSTVQYSAVQRSTAITAGQRATVVGLSRAILLYLAIIKFRIAESQIESPAAAPTHARNLVNRLGCSLPPPPRQYVCTVQYLICRLSRAPDALCSCMSPISPSHLHLFYFDQPKDITLQFQALIRVGASVSVSCLCT